jgi:hypothetical protein
MDWSHSRTGTTPGLENAEMYVGTVYCTCTSTMPQNPLILSCLCSK